MQINPKNTFQSLFKNMLHDYYKANPENLPFKYTLTKFRAKVNVQKKKRITQLRLQSDLIVHIGWWGPGSHPIKEDTPLFALGHTVFTEQCKKGNQLPPPKLFLDIILKHCLHIPIKPFYCSK